MGVELNEAELAELRAAIEARIGDLLDEAPLPSDPAGLERVAVVVSAPIRDADAPSEVGEAFAAVLEGRGDRDAAMLLAAMAVVAPMIAQAAEPSLERLRRAGIEPALPGGFCELCAVEARRGTLGDGSELYMVRVRRPDEQRSQVASVIVEREGELSGTLARGMISAPMEPEAAFSLLELEGDLPDQPQVEPVAMEQVERVLRDAVARMQELHVPAIGELALCLPLLGQALCGDAGALGGTPIAPPGSELFVDPEDEEGFEKMQEGLVAEFGAWVERTNAADELRRSGDLIAVAMLDWKWGYVDGRLGHWTIDDLEEFFLDYVPRKLPFDDELIGDAPECAAGFARFLNEVDLLTGDPIDELVACCRELRGRLAEAARDRSRWGPAKAMVAQMQAEGVNPTDEETLDAWMHDFNSRPREERDRVIGPALDRQVAAGLTGDPDAPLPSEIGAAVLPESGSPGMALALGWFPSRDYEEAHERWEELRELWAHTPHAEYCRRMEATLRGWAAHGLRPQLVALRLREYLPWCTGQGEDPAESRDHYAAEMLRLGRADPWPPGRNRPCWCGSGHKYKKCCGAVSASALHPLDASV